MDYTVKITGEKRSNFRAQTLLLAKINGNLAGTVLDISASGALLCTDSLFRMNDIVGIEIKLPNHNLMTSGRVVRIAGIERYGIEFINLSQMDKINILHYIFRYCVKNKQT